MENDTFYVILWKMTHFNPNMENFTMERDVVPSFLLQQCDKSLVFLRNSIWVLCHLLL